MNAQPQTLQDLAAEVKTAERRHAATHRAFEDAFAVLAQWCDYHGAFSIYKPCNHSKRLDRPERFDSLVDDLREALAERDAANAAYVEACQAETDAEEAEAAAFAEVPELQGVA